MICKDGSQRVWAIRATPLGADTSEASRVITMAVDVTERRRQERMLRQAAHVLASTREGVLITDADQRIISVNEAFTEITGYTEEEVLGEKPSLLSSGYHDQAFYDAMWAAIREHGHWEGETWNRRKSGDSYPEWLTISAVQDEAGRVTHYVGVFADMTRIKRSEAQLEQLTHYDPLTGLPNRLLLISRVEHALEQARRRHYAIALLVANLDGFKTVNESLGHAAGDEVLQVVSERLRARLRAEDTLARASPLFSRPRRAGTM